MIGRIRRTVVRRDDSGLTLSELIVAMMITSLALAVMGGFFATIARSVLAGRTLRTATSLATTGVDELSRVVRAAADVPTATGTSSAIAIGSTGSHLVVLSYVDTDANDPAPAKVDFSLNAAGALVEKRTAAVRTGTYWSFTGTTTTRVIPGPFTSGSPDLFVYLGGADPLTLAGTGLTSAQVSTVTAVTITVSIANQGRSGSDPVQVTTTAVMPNLALS